MRVADLARLGYGAALVVRPQAVARRLAGVELDRRAGLVARALGLRHVAQAVVAVRSDGPDTRRVGRRLDGAHALSMLVLAAWAPGRQRVALVDATVAALLGSDLHAAPPRRPRRATAPLPTRDLLDLPDASHAFELSVPVDTNPAGDTVSRRRHNAELQRAIHQAYLAARGADIANVRSALTAALHEQGLTPPSPQWLDAAAAEIASGYIYVVTSTAMRDVGLELPPHHPV